MSELHEVEAERLTKAAKTVGGPEKYVEILKYASKEKGRMEMVPWIIFVSFMTATIIKLLTISNQKRRI